MRKITDNYDVFDILRHGRKQYRALLGKLIGSEEAIINYDPSGFKPLIVEYNDTLVHVLPNGHLRSYVVTNHPYPGTDEESGRHYWRMAVSRLI